MVTATIKTTFVIGLIWIVPEHSMVSSVFHYMPLNQQHQPRCNLVVPSPCFPLSLVGHEKHIQYDENSSLTHDTKMTSTRRDVILKSIFMTVTATAVVGHPFKTWADDATEVLEKGPTILPVDVKLSGDAKKLYNEGRIYENQGNMMAAQRLYKKVTQISPRYVYGYSSLGNTQTALGELNDADKAYTISIDLCNELEKQQGERCPDLYALLLNRGCVRLNNGQIEQALADLELSNQLRARPDSFVLQNLARAQELNGRYNEANTNYDLAISMTANEVNPFWLRSSLVKYQLNDIKGGYDLLKRIVKRFPEATEVRAAYAVFLYQNGDPIAARQKFLEIPDKQRYKYSDNQYIHRIIAWPPKMIDTLAIITEAVGDTQRSQNM